ncbi:uncharacterized protein E5676_scaffold208G001340 [Cucumis melo var. makuwa]|uniref:Uncharacterized protein n=1 Tax=Cucumis melo var. makuwa TaxID=1194695 RepID=A0A5D3E2T4_CUCMM|nr:uncharacterized protein E5676_scaffold208G001340 [Cucumis melo var. makuwa]
MRRGISHGPGSKKTEWRVKENLKCSVAFTSVHMSNLEDWIGRVTFGDSANVVSKGNNNKLGAPNLDNIRLVEGLSANLINISKRYILNDREYHQKWNSKSDEDDEVMQPTDDQMAYLEVSVSNNPIFEKDPSDVPTEATSENVEDNNQQCVGIYVLILIVYHYYRN